MRSFETALTETAGLLAIDLGANLGTYTIKLAATCRKVIAFEPDPWTFSELQKAVGHLDNVALIEAAAGVEDATLPLYRHTEFAGNPNPLSQHSSMIEGKVGNATEATVQVQQIDFLRFLRDLDEDIGILKIDIEGAEVELLEALLDAPDLLARIRYIFAETHETRIPDHTPRVAALRAAALKREWPAINLYWH